MQKRFRLVLVGIASIFTMAGSACAQYIVESGSQPYKPSQKFDDDGNPLTSGKRLHKPGVNIDQNILQPGRNFDMRGRNIDEGTYLWDKPMSKPGHALNEETGKQKKKKRKVSDDCTTPMTSSPNRC